MKLYLEERMNARFKELFAMMFIRDGALCLLQPLQHVAIWDCGPQFYKKVALHLESHPGTARLLGLTFLGIGICLGKSAAQSNR
jgi:hypothetical protein